MSFTTAPNTAQRKILYVKQSTFVNMLASPAAAISECCYAYAQGYTDLAFYGIQTIANGGVMTSGNRILLAALINTCNLRGLRCIAIFAGDATKDAIIDFNNTSSFKFDAVLTEIEWWNYSSNLPWVSQDTSGNHSFYDTIEMFKASKPAFVAAGLELITYNGWTKTASAASPSCIYDSSAPVVNFDVTANKIVVQSDYTLLAGGKQFQTIGGVNGTGANQVIKITNFPKAGATTYFDITNVLPDTGNTAIYPFPSLASCYSVAVTQKSLTANVATLIVTFGSNVAPYRLDVGDNIIVSGVGVPYDGNHVITAVTGTSISFGVTNVNLGLTTVVGGIAKLRYSGSLSSAVKLSYNIAGVPTNQIQVRGDKTFRFAGVNRVTRINVTDSAGANILLTVNGTASYNSATKLTTIPVVESTTGITALTGLPVTFRGFADFDVGGKTDITYSTLFGFASEQEQLYELVDLHLIHSYVAIPNYSYPRSRMLQLGLAGHNTGIAKNVGFIVSAESSFSGPWFSGTGGAPKTVEQAYQYIVKNMAGTSPNQTGSPLYAQLETDAYINAWLSITTIAIFKDDLMQALTLGNGPNIFVSAGADQTITDANPGTALLNGSYCDDGLGGVHTVLWTIVSQPAGSPVATLTNGTFSAAILNYQRPGLHVLSLTVTDADGITNTSITNVLILSTSTITIGGDATNLTCNTSNDGEAKSFYSGGLAPYVFVITNGSYTDTNSTGWFLSLAAGTYTVSVTDSVGATGSYTIVITAPPAVNINLSTTQADCTPYDPGVEYTTDFNATEWIAFDGSCASLVTIDQTSSFKATTSGSLGAAFCCTISANASVVPAYPLCKQKLTLNFASIETDCTIILTGDATFITRNLTPFDSLTQVFDLEVAASNNLNIDITGTQTFALPKVIEITSLTIGVDTACTFLPHTGTATSTPSGGTAPYTVSWATIADPGHPFQVDGSILTSTAILATGSYIVTVTDLHGCEVSQNIRITQAPPITISANITNPGCSGTNVGSIELIPSGGVGPYTFQWTLGSSSTSNYIGSLYAGDYACTVTDVNGCTADFAATLTETTTGTVSIDGKRTFCEGEDLDLVATMSGGVAPYTYAWYVDSFLAGTGINLVLPPLSTGVLHSIEVAVTDVNGCIAYQQVDVEFEINGLPVIDITNSGPALKSCPGSQIMLTANNAGANTVEWSCLEIVGSLGTGTSIIVGNDYFLFDGMPGLPLTFQALISDGACTSIATIVVPYPVSTMVVIDQITPNRCGGILDGGAIDIIVSNGCEPYTYAWTGPGGFTATIQNISGLIDGTYVVIVEDVIGNSATASTIVFTSPPIISSSIITDNCITGNNGAVEIIITGGTAPYTFLWSNGATTQNISELGNGVYSVLVTDENECTVTGSFTVASNPLISTIDITYPFCDGSPGLAIITVSGGNQPYTYLWNTGETTDIIELPIGGTYSVIVTCPTGCSFTRSFFIPARVPISLTVFGQNPNTDTSNDGWAQVNVIGGSGFYTIEWSNGATTENNFGLAPGTYTAVVTDFNGCMVEIPITLLAINALEPPLEELLKKRYRCCIANIAYLAAMAEKSGSSKYECLEFKSYFVTAIFNIYCRNLNENNTCLTEQEKLNLVRILDEICNECKDCQ
jgi:hypothetical protein